jgi:hypothetical protein
VILLVGDGNGFTGGAHSCGPSERTTQSSYYWCNFDQAGGLPGSLNR